MYKIQTQEFKNKTEIIQKCREILYSKDGVINQDDYDFLLELFKYHPNYDSKIKNLKSIVIKPNIKNTTSFFIEYNNGFYNDISFMKCIYNIPVETDIKIDFNLNFGKYKNESINDVVIKDRAYAEWLCSKKSKFNRGFKIQIKQLLKYGYIPYNPVVRSKKKEYSLKD